MGALRYFDKNAAFPAATHLQTLACDPIDGSIVDAGTSMNIA